MLKVIRTADGSTTIYDEEKNHYYHSVHGALNESKHVFIKNGLAWHCGLKDEEVRILEVGFGTGLNALLSMAYAKQHKIKVNYTGYDPFPPSLSLIESLQFDIEGLTQAETIQALQIMHSASDLHFSNFKFQLVREKIQDANLPDSYFDIVYYDAFAFSSQPEMWEVSLFKKLFYSLKLGGILVTYAAKGQIKRDLKEAGFTVETLQGPPKKREMIRAHRK